MTAGRRCFAVLGFALGLGACALERPTSQVPTSYDFGPAPAYARANPAIAGTVLVASTKAPAWLEDGAIVYRLIYEDAARTHVYARSRWADEPAELITDRLRSRIAAVAHGVVAPVFGAHSDYTLRVELEDFSQHFAAPGVSRAHLRARATLLKSERRTLLAQRVFDVERPALPNAPGAVKALSEAADIFLDALVKWTTEQAQEDVRR